jgi:phosphatidylserine/phosphatidylglycerophosphate/cardiolipin synthase-like enzyme
MRYLLFTSICFLICFNAHAAQAPYTDKGALVPQKNYIHPQITSSAPAPVMETYLTPYDDAETRVLQFLDQAKVKCYIASYSITNPNIINKLIQLHDLGVDVEVLTDKTQAAGKRERAALAALEDSNILVFAGRSAENALMHCKFCVIDDHLVEDGSWNFTTSANREDNILNFVDSKQRATRFINYWFKIRSDMKY